MKVILKNSSLTFLTGERWQEITFTQIDDTIIKASGVTQSPISDAACTWLDVVPGEQYKISCIMSGACAQVLMNESTVLTAYTASTPPENPPAGTVIDKGASGIQFVDFPITIPSGCNKLGVTTRTRITYPIGIKKLTS